MAVSFNGEKFCHSLRSPSDNNPQFTARRHATNRLVIGNSGLC